MLQAICFYADTIDVSTISQGQNQTITDIGIIGKNENKKAGQSARLVYRSFLQIFLFEIFHSLNQEFYAGKR